MISAAGFIQEIVNISFEVMYMGVKNRLKEIRMKEYMMQQNEFASLLEISQGQYNRYEKGSSVPTLEIALKISYKLNLDVAHIFSLVD